MAEETSIDRHNAAVESIASKLFPDAPEEPTEEVAQAEDELPSGDELEVAPVAEGDDSDEEVEAADDSEEESGTVEIEIDGEILEVPERYKDYFLRQQDYTQKTQEIANQRKQYEAQAAVAEQTRQQYEFAQSVQDDVLKAKQLDSMAKEAYDYLRNNFDNLDSKQIEQYRFAISDAEKQRDELVKGLNVKADEFQQAQEQTRKELLNKGTEVLKAQFPDWSESTQKDLRDYALKNGYTEQEVGALVDPRQIATLYKSWKYDSLKREAPGAIKKVQESPAIKPKSRNPMPKDVGKKLNLRKTLKSTKSQADKADALGAHIAERFGML